MGVRGMFNVKPPQLVATRVRSPEKQNTSFGGGWAPSGTLQTISRGGVRGLLLRQRPSDLFIFLPCIDSSSRITEHCSNSTSIVVSRDDRDRDACFWLCPTSFFRPLHVNLLIIRAFRP